MQHSELSALNSAPGESDRIESIDALRGFDMFWIVGGASLVTRLHKITHNEIFDVVANQFTHVSWEGCHFYDIIFPLFVFLMGTSTVFSLRKVVARDGLGAGYRRLLVRAIVIYLLGLFYYGGMSRDAGPEMFRYVGVLQRIAICYLAGGVLFLNCRFRGLLISCAGLLIGYWILMAFVAVPGMGVGNFSEGKNLANYLDQRFLPGYKWDGHWDPEGLLSTLPAIGTGLCGIFAGLLLHRVDLTPKQKFFGLVLAGTICLLTGWLWSLQFPIVKKLWTSSFVLVTAGWSYWFLAVFYLTIDIWRVRVWAQPFVWLGMNAIAIYMLTNLVSFRQVVRRMVHEPVLEIVAPYDDLFVSSLALSLTIAVCYILYRQRIFIRV